MQQPGIKPEDVAALGICGQMAGIMGVDQSGMAVTPYDSWLDTRCGKYRQPFLDAGEERVIEITGGPVTYAHGPKILWWKYERPEVFKKIHRFVQLSSYCAMRLCGLDGDHAFIDHTYLHFSGFGDNSKRCWSGELLHALDVPEEKMPAILRPSDVVGRLTREMAAECGLTEGTPLVAGCGDTAASSFGAGIIRSGLLFDVAGTASVLACATEHYAPDINHKTIMYAPSVLEGLYTPMAYINGGGMCLKWLRDDVLQKITDYSGLDRMAEQISPGCDDLLFLPHFSGRVCPNDTLVRGSYINLSWKHGTAHMYRSIMEGIAYEYGIYADIIHELVPSLAFERVISVGGGSKSKLFGQIKSDVLGVPMSTIRLADTASLACCAIAGHGVGLYDDITSLVEKVANVQDTIEPDEERHVFYQYRKGIYAQAIEALHGVYGGLQQLEPWEVS